MNRISYIFWNIDYFVIKWWGWSRGEKKKKKHSWNNLISMCTLLWYFQVRFQYIHLGLINVMKCFHLLLVKYWYEHMILYSPTRIYDVPAGNPFCVNVIVESVPSARARNRRLFALHVGSLKTNAEPRRSSGRLSFLRLCVYRKYAFIKCMFRIRFYFRTSFHLRARGRPRWPSGQKKLLPHISDTHTQTLLCYDRL